MSKLIQSCTMLSTHRGCQPSRLHKALSSLLAGITDDVTVPTPSAEVTDLLAAQAASPARLQSTDCLPDLIDLDMPPTLGHATWTSSAKASEVPVATPTLSPTSSTLSATPATQDGHKNLAHAALACWHHLKGIRHRCYPRGDLLIELVPAARYGGSDFVEEICDVALELRGGDPEENVPVWRSMKTLEDMIRNYSGKLWQTTWA